MKLLTQTEAQERYWPTLEAIESLVERWRAWQTRRGKPLTNEENQAFWAWSHSIVLGASKRHFKQSQAGGLQWFETFGLDKHTARIDRFMKFLLDPRYTWPKRGEHRSPGWLVMAYRRRFPDIESELEIAQYGVGTRVLQWDENDQAIQTTDDKARAARHWREAANIERIRVTSGRGRDQLREVWEEDAIARGQATTDERWDNFRARYVRFLSFRELRHNNIDLIHANNALGYWQTDETDVYEVID